MRLPRALHRQLHARFDTWLRLRRWVRWLCGGLAVLLLAVVAFMLVRPAAPIQRPLSVKLEGPPALATASQPTDPALLNRLIGDRMPLPSAPLDALQVATNDGMLPRKTVDGRGGELTPLRAYAHPPAPLPPNTKRLAVLVLEVGLTMRQTQAAMALPGAVSLAYDAAAPNLADQISAARTGGHEAILDVPMQSATYPRDDTGPETLLIASPAATLVQQLHGFLARAPGAAAVMSRSGDRFVTQRGALWPLLQELSLRGLGWISLAPTGDQSQAISTQLKLPGAEAILPLDRELDEAAIRAQFDIAVKNLDQSPQIIMTVRAYPGILELLSKLLQTLPARGIALVPVTQLLK